MKDAAEQAVYLSDYAPFPYHLDKVALHFRLDPGATRVAARLWFRPGPGAEGTLRLDGERLRLLSTALDGAPAAAQVDDTGLTLAVPGRPFVLDTEVEIDPASNTALEGLYMSKGMYCTQCEAEGFRRITYFPDRPDVLAPFRVTVESDLPVLLSNGNPVETGPGRAVWDDPWPKPAYLFALVAGDLRAVSDRFVTASGRDVTLNVWVRPGDEDRCDYALDALKRSMRWDEEVYGREYDLDVFNIVAVDDFNMGAMENKGLNIFNSKYVLASPQTATDRDYASIEAIVAHEYFHNWTGNRITCRDWFQLCLKEGLTVFRDQEFTGDMRSHAVKRIEDVMELRGRQFREDNGPLSHPVRPSSYIEINNFYTATVYEKGAEIIGMLKRLVGDDGYAAALDLYFDRHDGQACTVEDWLTVFEDATGRDLAQFKQWYTQSGTPRVAVTERFENGLYTLEMAQHTPPTPGQPDKAPQVIPIAVGLLAPDGTETMPTTVLPLTEARQSFAFRPTAEGWRRDGPDAPERLSGAVPPRPVPSLNRGFSAPVILERDVTSEERALLLAHDTDPFNKWDAGRALAKDVLTRIITDGAAPGPAYLDALARVADDGRLDPAFRALALALPGDDDMAQTLASGGVTPDPDAIWRARRDLATAIARHLEPILADLYDTMTGEGPYSPDPKSAGKRSLRGAALALLSRIDGGRRAEALFETADNMTEEVGALACLVREGRGGAALARFYRRWGHDRLVRDKWFSLQVGGAAPPDAAGVAERLCAHPEFDWKTPNVFRSVFGALAGNHAGFHARDGAGYALLADWLIRLDPVVPQTAARMTTAFETWGRYDADRQALMRAALERIAAAPGLSRDTSEMVGRILDH
ncbi:aminopeptidase N [Rhodobacteraceae bacterium CCMM004]|nr:aminopeptidase N [Rhodobacteraceae bacterium CCMM004]